MVPDVTLLWLEPTPIGSAARTHLDGTLLRLQTQSVGVSRVIRSDGSGTSMSAKLLRLLRLIYVARRGAKETVLVARWHPFLPFVTRSWRRAGGKVLLLVQGNEQTAYEAYPWFKRIPLSKKLIRASLQENDFILALNDGLRKWLSEVIGTTARIEVMGTGVADVFFQENPDIRFENPKPYVLFFGNLARWQGIDYLLAAKKSSRWPTGVELLIIGDGEMADTVRAADLTGLRYLGRRTPEEVAAYVKSALVTVCPKLDLPSMAETTTPFKLLESAAAAVPVIATDIPAQRRILTEMPFGILTSLDDPAELAEAVESLHTKPELRSRLVENARAIAPSLRWEHEAPQLKRAILSAAR